MRFGINFLYSDEVFIPAQYRKFFLAFIKEALKHTEEGKRLYDYYFNERKNLSKPFTFSIHINSKQKITNRFLTNNIKFYFSTNNLILTTLIYNGIKKLEKYDPLHTNIKFITDIFPIYQKKIKLNKVMFKSLSPILVRDIKNKKGKGYLTFDHEDFIQNLKYNLNNLSKNFLDKEIMIKDMDIQIFEAKRVIVPTYGGEIGNNLIFQLKAPNKLLELVYDIGIGAKRSQGYGMVEVLR
ncbi:CRISPR-associated endoribonuclease Cas6 [Nitratiruptor tergarcus]|uniref:CRISPR-associated endoribonuclease Cas6 n=1 Tax=Nitratiruptor tergarcus DSM 16512 TaxID=1069081 RepID=A0A1W1WRF6_9BACT|nr:CRISPR-associated endoribonuclease Cas6 [Nitratiruptor tergarcus]SMC08867.1 CRISPR-associated endoribonuclease Cas6 [Nitratiruptor tergarcus DSM 16512]